MRLWIAGMTLTAGLLLTGCGNAEQEREIAQLKAENAQSKEAIANLTEQNDQLRQEKTRLDEQLDDAQTDLQALQARLEERSETEDEPAPEVEDAEVTALKQKITELEAEIERLKKQAEEAPDTEPESVETTEQPVETLEPAEVKRKVGELLPLVKGGDREAMNDMVDTIARADKATRDETIQQLRDWVKEDPENKHARLALATVLTTRFQDLKNPMQQGALAGEIIGEVEKATEIDPDYYEAQHFLAIMKVNYPAFTPEFKGADADLDKALELQQSMTWEDRFAEIYVHYSIWHRKQGQLDEAANWVQKGLDHAPRNQGLLDEQAAVEAARAEQEE